MNQAARGSLLGIEHLGAPEILGLLKLARRMNPLRPRPLLRGKRVLLLFYEASTRTRSSFEIAAKSLGAMTTLVLSSGSSIEKGESLLDTGYTLRAVGADVIVIRHPQAGAAALMARNLKIPVINAGDGMHEHPTQALLDALTIRDRKGKLEGLNVTILGDILHSRVARSDIQLFGKFGTRITLCGPAMWVPRELESLGPNIQRELRIERSLEEADVVIVLRVQTERMHEPALAAEEFILGYQLTVERLRLARPGALVLHPGPMIRGLEIDPVVADGAQSCVLEQVTNGLAVRMALLYHLVGGAPVDAPHPAKERSNAAD